MHVGHNIFRHFPQKQSIYIVIHNTLRLILRLLVIKKKDKVITKISI